MTSHDSQPMPTPDLAALLSRRAPSRAAPPQAQPESRAVLHPPEPTQTDADSTPGEHTVALPSADTPPPRGRVYLQSITVYLPRTTAQRLTDAAAAAEMTRTAFILQAVNATHTDIADSSPEAAQVGVGNGDLFAVPQAHRGAKAPSVQTTIRVTDDQLAGLTRLAAQAGTNRSRAITACLELYLFSGQAPAS